MKLISLVKKQGHCHKSSLWTMLMVIIWNVNKSLTGMFGVTGEMGEL